MPVRDGIRLEQDKSGLIVYVEAHDTDTASYGACAFLVFVGKNYLVPCYFNASSKITFRIGRV